MSRREVAQIISPQPPHFVGDGFRMHNFIPKMEGLSMQRMDPFIMLDYGSKYYFPASDKQRGVGVHPHKGFETVTIAYKGAVAHHDSSGGGGVIKEGDVQWMTAGSGILHKEYHDEEWSKKGGDFQMVQLWVNLSAENKKQAPKYQAIEYKNIQRYELEDNAGFIEIIAGEYNGIKGSASTFSPIHLYNVKLKKGRDVSFNFPATYNTAMLVIEGSIKVNEDKEAATDHFVLMQNEEGEFTVQSTEDAIVLLLSGEPINEPIASHGPFVMNTRDELIQAFNDFNNGKFGYLED